MKLNEQTSCPSFLQRAMDGQDLVIYGDESQSRDFVRVSDVTRFLAAAMEESDASTPVTNGCIGRGTSVFELGNTLIKRYKGRIVHDLGRPGDIRRSLGAPELAAKILGVQAQISFEQGLTTLGYY
ncbi:NAD-dependent epimerase/dehydratase family protein [Microvirga terrestris]|uniref:NAD-dependent epimerase/dehydratase family protein n=1 Tax=Microvirga terrestris TaxID=2791024 RepID=A0ABS0HPC9_9HYPH|nr:NAD-dependent epimerase/dehydratase family protein [Microvirga terrestris]MBF9195337.1 NAD-dependent epimerase/dehydratase family protein [Microvirga terrestris]